MTEHRKRVVILIPTHWSVTMGGAEYQCKLLCDHLKTDSRFEVHWVSKRVAADYLPDGYNIHRIGVERRFASRAYFLDRSELWQLLDEIQPEIIYQRNGCGYTGIAAQWARARRAHMVWNVAHDAEVSPVRWGVGDLRRPFRLIDRRLMQRGIRMAHQIVAQTNYQRHCIQRSYPGAHVHVIPNFHPLPQEEVVKQSQVPTVVWVANLKRSKQPELFIRLANELRDAPARLVMVGQPSSEEPWMSELRAAISAAPNLEYLGRLQQEQVNNLLAGADLLVNTSTQEGFSNTFIQAWLREVPVISLNSDPDNLLQSGGLGACAGGDWNAFVDAIKTGIVDVGWRKAAGSQAKEYALRKHSVLNMTSLIQLLSLPLPSTSEEAHSP